MSRLHGLPPDIHVPAVWEQLARELVPGPVFIVGATDAGKSTFAAWLVGVLAAQGESVGLLDADMGQPGHGIPGTMNLLLPASGQAEPLQAEASWFVGDTTPARHMLPVLAGVQRLRELAVQSKVARLVIDTTGLVSRQGGGVALKRWKAEMLRPGSIVALRKADELEDLLGPWRTDSRFRLVELDAARQVRPRSPEQRAMRRRDQWRRAFAVSTELMLARRDVAVYEPERLHPGRLAGLVDACGLLQSPGIVQRVSEEMIALRVPAGDLPQPAAIWGGDAQVEL